MNDISFTINLDVIEYCHLEAFAIERGVSVEKYVADYLYYHIRAKVDERSLDLGVRRGFTNKCEL